jgi:hypothetical protein
MRHSNVSDPTVDYYRERYIKNGVEGFINRAGDPFNLDFNLNPISSAVKGVLKGGKSSVVEGNALHIGFDSEYVFDEKAKCNVILSYQYSIIYKNLPPLTGIIYTATGEALRDGVIKDAFTPITKTGRFKSKDKHKERLKFNALVSQLVQIALDAGYLKSWASEIFIYAHFLRADLASFSDFFQMATSSKLQGNRGTLTGTANIYGVNVHNRDSKRLKPKSYLFYDKSRNKHQSIVHFVDTMLLSPNGSSLEAIGQLIDLPKGKIPADYDIARMDLLLLGNKTEFEQYALRDAEIAVYYGLFMQVFVRVELGLNYLPSTLSGCGLAYYKKLMAGKDVDLNALFGKKTVKTVRWDKLKGKPVYRTEQELTAARNLFESLAINCYLGGYNTNFCNGITPVDNWSDFDLTMAYPTPMTHLKPLDFDNARMNYDPNDFTCKVVGIAYISFKFPEGTLKPCLPVKTENGLIYPLESAGAYVCSPEIQVALETGAEVKILHGVIVPFVEDSEPLFFDFIQQTYQKRKSHPKNSLLEKLFKELLNSLYGRVGMGLKDKMTFDVSTGFSEKLPYSPISCPYLASHICSTVRAVVSEQIAFIPAQYTVLSVTTDGFLTNAPLSAINMDLPLSSHYRGLLNAIDGDAPVLACKHKVKQLIVAKTRGAFTLIADGTELITAKCGIKPDCDKASQNDYMVGMYIGRVPYQAVTNYILISLREMFLKGADLIGIERTVKINLEPDFKRQPVNPVMQSFSFNGVEHQHIYLESVPWRNVDEFMMARCHFDGWRQGRAVFKDVKGKKEVSHYVDGHCLKTVEDWSCFLDYQVVSQYIEDVKATKKGSFKLSNGRDSVELLRRLFIIAFTNGLWGLECVASYKEMAAWLSEHGYDSLESDFKNSKGKHIGMPVVPVTPLNKPLLELLENRFPNMNQSLNML